MAISVFPAPVTSTLNASAITAVSANVLYQGFVNLDPAIYSVTCTSGVTTNIEFYSNATTVIAQAQITTGTQSFNIATAVDRVRVWTTSGTNQVIQITKTAAALTNVSLSSTLDTITTVGSSTYTGTSTSGYGYAVLVGGGGGGGSSDTESLQNGGGAGGICAKLVQLTGSMAVVIGAGGAKNVDGGSSTFAGMTAGGGTRGNGSGAYTGGAGGTATGGTLNATGGVGGARQGVGGLSVGTYTFVTSNTGTTAGGSGDPGGPNSLSGVVGGLGTGGGSFWNGSAMSMVAATGYGSGGAGGTSSRGNAGTQGVLYVLRY